MLVDNIVFPKYLFEYNISEPNNPILLKTEDLPNNGTYEHIIKGDINKDWLVLFSSTMEQWKQARHIVIKGKRGKYKVLPCFWEIDRTMTSGELFRKPTFEFKDICLAGKYLVVLRNNGVTYLDLEEELNNNAFKMIQTRNKDYEKLIKTRNNDIIARNRHDYEIVKQPLLGTC